MKTILIERPLSYHRRRARVVWIGQVGVGGNYPIRVQSMTTSDTKNTSSLVCEIEDLVNAGCEIVRMTVPTQADCDNLPHIKSALSKRGIKVPLVADIHFTPSIAMKAVEYMDKVRINPGNFVDKKLFKTVEYTDSQYAAELSKIRDKFIPLVQKCKEYGVALRIGTNHGSLSDRIMNRYGDTPEGMVASAIEFLEICEDQGFKDIIFSMKASNVQVMTSAYRLLAQKFLETKRDYPFHLGVTEAGEGEDGRIKSAIGIGSLLEDGIGDTIRVSLTEDAVHEIPVAYELVKKYNSLRDRPEGPFELVPLGYHRRISKKIPLTYAVGGDELIRVWLGEECPTEKIKKENKIIERCLSIEYPTENQIRDFVRDAHMFCNENGITHVFYSLKTEEIVYSYRLLAKVLKEENDKSPIHLRYTIKDNSSPLLCAVNLGCLLLDGIGDSLQIDGAGSLENRTQLANNILQGCRLRIYKTEYISCPSCGRTLFDLQTTTKKIQEATSHLKGVKIAVMGCIVNGPGEMADADFGYVGTGPKKISLYVGKECVERNIPEEEAVERLMNLIKTHP